MRLLMITVPPALEHGIKACRPHFATAALFSALVNILYLAPTLYMMQVYDRVVPTGGILTLFWLTVIVATAIGTLTALDAIRSRLMVRASLRLDRKLGGEILDRLMARPKLQNGQPTAAQAMREFDQLRQTLGGPPMTALFDLPWTPLYVIVAFLIHPALGGLIIVSGAILVGLGVANERHTKALIGKAHMANAAAYASQEAAARQGDMVRALGMRRALVARQIDERRAGLDAGAEAQFAGSRYNGLIKFFRMFLQSAALGLGAWLAVAGQISVGAIIAASVLLSRALQPVEQMVGFWPGIIQSRMAIESLGRLLGGAHDDSAPRTALPMPEGRLTLDQVGCRSADGTTMILNKIGFTLSPGEILGVIGPSGAGKSTLARVAARALMPDCGEVRIDDANANDWDAELLARHIGYMPQDNGLLPGTITENISRFAEARGVPRSILDDAVVSAAQVAGVHEMILRLPKGYDTVIEGNGHKLSAGQAQRVALARALYDAPKILILDEPNAALDSEGEAALARAIAVSRHRGAAIMIVAHRASILADADRLMVLQAGMIAQLGPREEVLTELRERAARANVVPMKGRGGQ